MQTFRILSVLLGYPGSDLLAALPSFGDVLRDEALLPSKAAEALEAFVDKMSGMPILDAQERYVGLFDRNRSLSLHIYEHVHGESRERGQAMVRLAELYHLHGMHISARELPDYLPLFLEFLSVLPLKAARSLLADAVHVVSALAEKLERRANPYAAVLRAVEALAVRPAQAHVVAKTVAALGGDADTLAALDRQWEEEAVRFVAAGGPDGSAGTAACGGV